MKSIAFYNYLASYLTTHYYLLILFDKIIRSFKTLGRKLLFFYNHFFTRCGNFFFPQRLRLDSAPAFKNVLELPPAYLFAAEDEGRTEDPTEYKKRKAREDEGKVAKSQEIPAVMGSLGAIIVLFLSAGWVLTGIAKMLKLYLGNFTLLPEITEASVAQLIIKLSFEAGILLVPIFIAAMAMATLGNLIQVGLDFNLKLIKFKWTNLSLSFKSLAQKVLFSKNVFVNLLKTMAKVALITATAYLIITADFLTVMKTGNMGIGEALQVLGFISFKLALILVAILLAMSVPDYFYQRHVYIESLKMTKQEVKEEYKSQEGDPLMKMRRRQKAMELLRRGMIQSVKEADVVITNPTHYAVAVSYQPERFSAPFILAKGEDMLALQIRRMAKAHNIAIIENKPLARALYASANLGEEIPPEFYDAILKILLTINSFQRKIPRKAG